MNITKNITTLTTWCNADSGEKIQYESDTDTYFYFNKDGELTATWETKQNADIVKLCSTGVKPVYIAKQDYIDNPDFVHFILTLKYTTNEENN